MIACVVFIQYQHETNGWVCRR